VSALPHQADVLSVGVDVRFVPEADMRFSPSSFHNQSRYFQR
jgi:hypothetical protein